MEAYDHSDLIQKLLDCSLACEHCATACLNETHVNNMKRCVSLDRDCADLCFQAVRLLARDSEIGKQFLLLCEEICRLCAAECGEHNMDHCQACAEACITCADACHANHETILQS